METWADFIFLLNIVHSDIDAFALLWQQYSTAFDEWKNADRQRLIAELVDFWQQAEQLKCSILGSKPETDAQLEVVQDIEHRQQKLEQDLRRLGGEVSWCCVMKHDGIMWVLFVIRRQFRHCTLNRTFLHR